MTGVGSKLILTVGVSHQNDIPALVAVHEVQHDPAKDLSPEMADHMSTSLSASDVDVPRESDDSLLPRGRRRRRRPPLAVLVREKRVHYKRFMKRILPKNLRGFGFHRPAKATHFM
ncbi:hypothetical protein ACF0H5_008683 [Mactra antiquata]